MTKKIIEVFKRIPQTERYESAGMIDQFKSLIVNKRAFSFNTFQLGILIFKMDKQTKKLVFNHKLFELLRSGNRIVIDDCAYEIDAPEVESLKNGLLIVKGKSLFASIKRVINPPYHVDNRKSGQVIYDLINTHLINPNNKSRAINSIALRGVGDYQLDPVISYQNSYGQVVEEVVKLCDSNQIVLIEKAHFSNGRLYNEFLLSKGKDCSGAGGVEFSFSNQMLSDEGYIEDTSDYANVAYVFGEDKGKIRKNLTLGSATGMNRKELYVDARDVQSEFTNTDTNQTTTLTEAQYMALLSQRGRQQLSEREEIRKLTGELNSKSKLFKYGADYRLGDKVLIKSKTFGFEKACVLTAIQETWDSTGYYLTPTFDKDSPTIISKMKRG